MAGVNQFSRTELLLGAVGMARLHRARVAVFGLGGVGGHAMEALARSGVGTLDLIDNDRVSLTNLNRQLIATHRTLGQQKVEAARQRVAEISPQAVVHTHPVFFTPETAGAFDFSRYDYVVDAIDTVSGKLELAEGAYRSGTPIISAMGAGNKLDPTALEVADIYATSVCPLARVMRRELKRRGIPRLKVVYSREPAISPLEGPEEEPCPCPPGEACTCLRRRQTPGSTAFVPAVAGLILAGEVIRDLARGEDRA